MKRNHRNFSTWTLTMFFSIIALSILTPFAQAGEFIELEPGVEIYYEQKGDGPTILFVPGWTFTTEVFVNQLDKLSASYRVVVIDPRSHGRSTVTLEGNDYITPAIIH
jgi:hypothetical protein